MSVSSANAITSPTTSLDAVQPATVGSQLDRAQFVLRKPALPPQTGKTLARDWARLLSAMGLVESQVVAVFDAALAAKSDTFPLSWPEVRAGALKVLSNTSTSTFQRLDEGDCDFFWSMIPVWAEQDTAQSREYLAMLWQAFEAHATTEPELRVLFRLRQCVPQGESVPKN